MSSGIILMGFGRSPQKIVWKYLVTEKKREMGTTITKTHIYNCSKRILDDPNDPRQNEHLLP